MTTKPLCTCGAELPQHMADLWTRGVFKHTCSCYTVWEHDPKTKTWTDKGKGPNPFADYDNARLN